jgi:excisionase family DNA binding protein
MSFGRGCSVTSDLGHALLGAVREMDAEDLDELRRLLGVTEAPAPREPGALTCSQAAARARCCVETIRRAVRSGALPAGNVGRSPRIAEADLDGWLAESSSTRPARAACHVRTRARRRPMADALARHERRTR